MSKTLLSVENLVTEYGRGSETIRAVDNVSFELLEGTTLGIAGESGCGKTTLALSIAQLLPENARIKSGSVIFDGKDLTRMNENQVRRDVRWKRISMIFQGSMSALNPVMRIDDLVVEAIRLHNLTITKASARERASELFASVGIPKNRIRSYPHELSGGMRQRAMISLALACSPDLIIADEPTTALDVLIQAQIIQLLRSIREKFHKSLIFISHDLSVIAQLADRCAVMYAGKIVEIGSVRQVYKNPLHPYTMRLLRAFPDVKSEHRVPLVGIAGEPPSLSSPPSACRFNPRCEYVMNVCKEKEPKMIEFESGHSAACHWREMQQR